MYVSILNIVLNNLQKDKVDTQKLTNTVLPIFRYCKTVIAFTSVGILCVNTSPIFAQVWIVCTLILPYGLACFTQSGVGFCKTKNGVITSAYHTYPWKHNSKISKEHLYLIMCTNFPVDNCRLLTLTRSNKPAKNMTPIYPSQIQSHTGLIWGCQSCKISQIGNNAHLGHGQSCQYHPNTVSVKLCLKVPDAEDVYVHK